MTKETITVGGTPPLSEAAEYARGASEAATSSLPAVATGHQQQGILSIIESAVANPAFDVNKLEKLLEMQERIMKKNAEIAFNNALTRLSADLPRIVKKNSVSYKNKDSGKMEEAFKFASYDDIDVVLRPLLSREGFHPAYDTQPREGGGAIVTCTLLHVDGHSMKSSVPVALDNSGGKNNIQGMGSTISYGKRYALCMMLNIVTVGEDDDGQTSSCITPEQVKEINELLDKTKADKTKFLEFAQADSVEKIQAKAWDKAITMLKAKEKAINTATIKTQGDTKK